MKEISDALKGLPRDIAQKILNQSTRRQVVAWQDKAISLAPISQTVHVVSVRHRISKRGELFSLSHHIHVPGTLRRSIKVKKLKDANETSLTVQEARFGIKILGKAFYWKFVEFGSIHNKPPLGFLRATFAALAEPSLQAVAGDCRKGIEDYFRRVKKISLTK